MKGGENMGIEITVDQLWEIINEMRDDIEKLEDKLNEAKEEIESLTERMDDCESNMSAGY